MRAQLLHLSGPQRGRTVTHEGDHVLIGTDPDADVRFPEGGPVQPRHAEIAFVAEGCAFYLRRIEGQVFVNRREVTEVILEQGDLLEIGKDGPRIRFRIYQEKGAVCKPVRQMLGDAQEVGKESGIFAFTRSIIRDLLTHASWKVKVGVPVLGVLILLPVAFFAGWLGAERYGKTLEEVQEELGRIRDTQDASVSREEVEQIRAAFEARDKVVQQWVAESDAIKRIHGTYSRGVCLLYGAYSFLKTEGGQPRYLQEFGGQRVELEYVGSGFLATADGQVITNRHIAEPWIHDHQRESLEPLGYEPVFLRFLAVFPGRDPVEVDPATVVVRSDDIDVAVIRVTSVEGVPVLPLYEGDLNPLRGDRVVLLGYPTGVNALLAKAEREVVDRLAGSDWSLMSIIGELAESRAITPIITQGSLSEILDKQVVYDADTTRGGSGGPLFAMNGAIIGVNYAILPEFSGSSFGVPIRFAEELLAR